VEIEGGLAGMRPKDGVDGYSGDKSEFDYAISHDEQEGGQEETGTALTLTNFRTFQRLALDDHLSPR
jgi:hypothetical protein